MKKFIYILIVVLAVGGIAFVLKQNKQEMAAQAAVAERKSEAIPVSLTSPASGKLDRSFTVQGNFEAAQDLMLLSDTQGRLVKIYKEKGQRVKAGEVLAEVDTELMRAEYMRAEAAFTDAKRDLGRYENLAAGEAITQSQLEDARLRLKNAEANMLVARKRLADGRITAPISGQINDKFVEVGSFISPGTKLFNLVNLDELTLTVRIPEDKILLVQEGQEVELQAKAAGNTRYTGTVKSIAAKADNALNYAVEIRVKNAQNAPLKAGMYGTASFGVEETREALLLNREAIVGSLQQPKVYVVRDGKAYLQQVSVGEVQATQVEIVGGLQPGDQVVKAGQINLQDGIQVRVL